MLTARKTILTAVLALVLGSATCLGLWAAPQDRAAQDTAKLQGSWRFISVEQNGKKTAGVEMEVHGTWVGRVVIRGNHVELAHGKQASPFGTFTLNPAADPPAMDLRVKDGPDGEQSVPGIYSLRGDELRVCFADESSGRRPTALSGAAGTKQVVYVFKRMSRAEIDAHALWGRQAEKLAGSWVVTGLKIGDDAAPAEQLKGLNVQLRVSSALGLTFRRDRNVLSTAAFRMDPMRFNRLDLVLGSRLTFGPGLELAAGLYGGTYGSRQPDRLHLVFRPMNAGGQPTGTGPTVTLELRRNG